MRILLIGECYSSNVGDQVVASITKEILSRLYPSSSVVLMDISGRKKLVDKNENVKPSSSERYRAIIRKYVPFIESLIRFIWKRKRKKDYLTVINNGNYNLAVFCGGQVINSVFSKQMSVIGRLLSEANIPTVYSSVGLGIINKADIKIFKQILEYPNVKSISCRCDEKRFNSIFCFDDNRVHGSFDPGVCASKLWGISRKIKADCIGLGIMSSSRVPKERMILFWKRIISCLEDKSIKWKMFYTGTWNDYLLAKEILVSLKVEPSDSILCSEINSPFDLLNELSQFSKIISFRLHSHILSYSLGIPSIAISWDKKIDDFFCKIGNAERVFRIDSDVESIISALENCDYIAEGTVQDKIDYFTKILSSQCEQALS